MPSPSSAVGVGAAVVGGAGSVVGGFVVSGVGATVVVDGPDRCLITPSVVPVSSPSPPSRNATVTLPVTESTDVWSRVVGPHAVLQHVH